MRVRIVGVGDTYEEAAVNFVDKILHIPEIHADESPTYERMGGHQFSWYVMDGGGKDE